MPYITATEMKWRMREGLRILRELHSDMCRASTEDVSREMTQAFTYLLNDLTKFSGKIEGMVKAETQTTITAINPITCRCDYCGESMNVKDQYCAGCGKKVVEKEV